MPYRARFDCLWCGDAWTARGPGDLEGWAQLCPTCLGRAGTNTFLRSRLRAALTARAAAGEGRGDGGTAPYGGVGLDPAGAALRSPAVPTRPKPPAPIARSDPAFPDDWFLRRGPFERGPVHDTAWAAELDAVIRWLDAQPLGGRILEPAAGVGFFSPLLAERGELHAHDADAAALDVARQRLLAHHLLAHLHPADPWTPPAPADEPFDALVASFLLGRVRGAGLDRAAATLRGRLRAGGALALVDLRPDPAGGPPEGIRWSYHDPEVVEAALARAGFAAIDDRSTGRFFTTASATAG